MILGLGGLPEDDLGYVVDTVQDRVGSLADARVLVTGATGFVGRWLVASLVQARRHLDLPGLAIQVLVRDAKSAQLRLGEDLWAAVEMIEADVKRSWALPQPITHVIHGATPSSKRSGSSDARDVLVTSVIGTHNLLRALGEWTETPRVLHLSSGAVYGPQPLDLPGIPENWAGGPSPYAVTSPYAEGKRAAEALLELSGREGRLHPIQARLFAFLGPGLPTDEGFAIGNFAARAAQGENIRVLGDGSTVRSYLNARQLASWLFLLLLDGKMGVPYNVGSPRGEPLRYWAEMCASIGGVSVSFGTAPVGERARYVPDVSNSSDLGISLTTDDPLVALESWIRWLKASCR